jgi:hypothetical protein
MRESAKRSKSIPTGHARPRRGARTLKTYRLDAETVAVAQGILGAATAVEAIEAALDMVVFRHELVAGTRAMLGTDGRPTRWWFQA